MAGKMITIVYAIVGMPLFLLYLSNIGDIMARCFKWIYAKICLCKCCPGVSRRREERKRMRLAALSIEDGDSQTSNEDVWKVIELFFWFYFARLDLINQFNGFVYLLR